ncbi:MAG TPA: alpha-ketoglutarate-dependent dioxygenase AlkB [Caulobacteraceae bacterium]|nr:alpha-ketoglutarate-dependent dioxygenase AlkB [Caulobacteraceae bacterium]
MRFHEQQGDLFGAEAESPATVTPAGFRYWPDVITPEAEAGLAAQLETLPFTPYAFRGYLANRRVVGFGARYDDASRVIAAAEPIPDWLRPLQARIARLAGLAPEAFATALINEYAPGAGIGWHRDRPQFGRVAGVSLLSPCVLRLRRRAGAGWERVAAPLAPRSAYLLSGPARHAWQHSITPGEALRYSITFRTLAADRAAASGASRVDDRAFGP